MNLLASLSARPAIAWPALAFLSLVMIAVIDWLTLPAAFLLGSMFAAILFALSGTTIRPNTHVMALAQGVLGVLIAHTMPVTIFAELARDWMLVLGLVVSVIALSFAIGWVLAVRQILPGTTAIWGSAPGAASAMILMSESADADMRLVAFMQYLRVVMVATVASFIARFALGSEIGSQLAIDWLAPFPPSDFALTIAICCSGMIVTRFLPIPAINMILPMLVGIAAHTAGLTDLPLPPWLLAASYTLLGWYIGLRFTRDIMRHALKALPVLVASTASLIALCGGMAIVVSQTTGMDLLTAYLATSPGGADSIAIIAAASPVDKPFVLALQTARFLIVLVAGPVIARMVANRFALRQAAGR